MHSVRRETGRLIVEDNLFEVISAKWGLLFLIGVLFSATIKC